MVWVFLAAIALAVWFFGATTFLVLIKTDRTDLSLAFWDPDGIWDSLDVSAFEWVLALSWPLWIGLVISVIGSVLWAAGRRAVNQLIPARAQQASAPTSTTTRQAQSPARSTTPKERFRAAASAVRREARANRSPAEIALDEQRKREEAERRERSWKYRAEHYVFYLDDDERVAFEARGEEEQRNILTANTEKAKRARDWARRAQGHAHELSPEEREEFESLALPQKQRRVSARERKLRLENVQAERERREAAALQRTTARNAAKGLRAGVQVRPPKDADDFETVCAEWVKKCGVKADRTKKGPDGGLDLIGPDFAGQCKFHPANKVGAPDVQQLAGVALGEKKNKKAFFHYGPGYTPAAVEAARKTGVELWQFDPDAQTFRRILD